MTIKIGFIFFVVWSAEERERDVKEEEEEWIDYSTWAVGTSIAHAIQYLRCKEGERL